MSRYFAWWRLAEPVEEKTTLELAGNGCDGLNLAMMLKMRMTMTIIIIFIVNNGSYHIVRADK